ncbi:MAG: CRISPR-associated helicase Cas3' [Methylotenera sp.]|nr:CRISPR-associated helicase Cas3' [Methylotenera sp.]
MLGRHNKKTTEVPEPLPLSLSQCLAKSRKTDSNMILPGRLVLNHCQIVGEVARAMIHRMPSWLRDGLFPDGAALIAAAHDIGKVSPTFQKKIHTALSQKNETVFLVLKAFNVEAEKQWGGHAGVSQAAAKEQCVGEYIPEILGQHHGFSPNLSIYQATCEVFGGQPWQEQRTELIAQLKQVLEMDFPLVRDALQARVLAGLTTVSDWIGSGSLFEDPNEDWRSRIELALDAAGYVKPALKLRLSFNDVFGFDPKDTQIKLIEAANQSGVYVLEAPMGLGKTEAALYAAYQLLEKELATGIYFALPTQLTSDKIHERVNVFLDRILEDDSPHKQALLVHGNAWLKTFEMGEEGSPGGAWFAQGKRGILAPFAVGTIDQALMAVMNVKHGFVRTFGLAGKVVILDEVHSYDSFTGTILDALVKDLRQLHCTVIILSATLTQERRAKLLGITPISTAYPLITAQPNVGELVEASVELISDVSVAISHQQQAFSIDEALCRAESGQQVLWIENTVNEAQEIYGILNARACEMGVACGLLHSRYIKTDRTVNESKWVTFFGKEGAETRAQQGRILVGTQVLEQSLDIDADFLITRIAPTDMLLQRLGRLWRHTKTVRPESAKREAWILSPELVAAIESPELAFGTTAKVYAPYVLCRSLAVWKSIANIGLPSQIRELIEATYAEQDESEQMAKYLHQVEAMRTKLERLALLGLSKAGTTQPEEKAQTRHSEIESTEVLLIRAYQYDTDKQGTWVTLLNGTQLFVPANGRSLSRQRQREITATLMQNTLKVADYLAPDAVLKKQIDWLGDYFYLGRPEYDESAMLRVALVNESGEVKSISHGIANDSYHISYDALTGYHTKKKP